MVSENYYHASIFKLIVPNHYTFIEFKFWKDWAIFRLRYFFYEKSIFFLHGSILGGQETKKFNKKEKKNDIKPTEWLKLLSKMVLTRKNMIFDPEIPKF